MTLTRCDNKLKMAGRGATFWSLLIVGAIAGPSHSSRAQQGPPSINKLFPFANIPLPPGPYASWPEQRQDMAVRGLRSRCMLVAGMAFGDYQGPRRAMTDGVAAITSACVVKQMPNDWPGRSAEQAREATHYRAAKAIDPQFPDPDLLVRGIGH